MKIIEMTNKEANFYNIMGPFLANRAVEKIVGYQLYDDKGKKWIIAMEGDTVVGFCYLWGKTSGHYDIGSCYAATEKQKQLFKKIINKATKGITGKITLATKNKNIAEVLIKEGFTIHKELKNITEYIKEIE